MSLNRIILCSKLKNNLFKIVTKSQVITKFDVTKSRLHCTFTVFIFKTKKMAPKLLLFLNDYVMTLVLNLNDSSLLDDSWMTLRWLQDDSKMTPIWLQDDSKTTPRRLQDDPKMTPRWLGQFWNFFKYLFNYIYNMCIVRPFSSLF